MTKRLSSLAAALLCLTAGAAAQAHRFTCEQRVNGKTSLTVDNYPATLTFDLTVTNPLTGPSTATSIDDAFLRTFGGPQYTLPSSGTFAAKKSVTDSVMLVVDDQRDCNYFACCAAHPGACEPYGTIGISNVCNPQILSGVTGAQPALQTILSTLTVDWDTTKSVSCATQVTCAPQTCLGCRPGSVTRNLGWYKRTLEATAACAYDFGIPLDILTGLFFYDPHPLSDYDRIRFYTARDLAVAACNSALFGATYNDPGLLYASLIAVLEDGPMQCKDMQHYRSLLNPLENCGLDLPIPIEVTAKLQATAAIKGTDIFVGDPFPITGAKCGRDLPVVLMPEALKNLVPKQ